MEFKELPKEIQEIAAHTLRQRLNEVALEAETKKDIDNMARNVRDAFTGLYSVSVEGNNIPDEQEESTAPHQFWKSVEVIAKAKLLELNNLYHRENDGRQSLHHQGVATLIALTKEQGEYHPVALNDTVK
ncbi:TPA: hypothetical protein JLF87_004129 [Escherichia coli]|nr:hypothetical protein [Escherichia coli]HAV9347339.1 hypothetical protein [Escherichia coli]HBE4929063.1 hypothetical protein [Escherichia coli]